MMRKVLFLCILSLLQPLCLVAQDNVIDRVEWVVGDKCILRSDIEEAIRFWQGNGKVCRADALHMQPSIYLC